MLNMINSLRRSILLLVFCFYIHGFSNSLAVSDCFQFLEKVFGFVVVERRVPIIPQKRAGHSIATLAVEIAGSKGRASSKEGKLEVEPVEGRR